MALVDLNHIQFYQPSTKARLRCERISNASNAYASVDVREGKTSKVSGSSDGWDQRPWSDDAIEFIELIDSPSREHFSPFRKPLPDFQERSFFDERSLTSLITANGHYNTSGFNHIISEDPNDFLTLEESLLDSEETRKSRRADWGREHKEELSEPTTKEDSGGITTRGSTRSSDVGFVEREARGGGDSSSYNSDGLNASGYNKDSNTLNTQSTFVSSSEDGCLLIREMNMHFTFNTSPSYVKNLLSTPGKKACRSRDGDHIDIGPDPFAGEDREDRWDPNETEAGHEEDKEETKGNGERHDGDTPLLLSSTKKSPLFSAKKKGCVKRRVKHRRFSSPLSSNEDTAIGDESDISSYTSSRPHRPSRPQPTSFNSTDLQGDTCHDSKMKVVDEPSHMAVIYEQQSWEREIVDERDMKQGRGRPRKQYLVRWKPSWVDGGHLAAHGLVENWREKKKSEAGR